MMSNKGIRSNEIQVENGDCYQRVSSMRGNILPLHQDGQDQEDEEDERPVLNVPYFTIVIIASHLIVYFCGLYLIGFNNVEFSRTTPISLPNDQLIFLSVAPWPECQNIKSQYWRLLSHQFVHAGLFHLLSNQIMTLLFGMYVEITHGFWKGLLIYEFGILGGILCHYACLPYRGLIGCSHGVYALYGATISLCLSSLPSHSSFSTYRYLIYFTIFLQLMSDIFSFLLFYEPSIGYVAHVGGFLSGFLLGFAALLSFRFDCVFFLVQNRRNILPILTLAMYLALITVILERYLTMWPPAALIPAHLFHWLVQNQNDPSCCEEMLSLLQQGSNISLTDQMNQIQNQFYCNGHSLESF